MYSTTRFEKNVLPFSEISDGINGRQVLYSDVDYVSRDNVVDVLSKALYGFRQNKREIEYLDRYYRGDQPIKYRVKEVRPEINNKIVENHVYEFVEFLTAQNSAEPVQYVSRGADDAVSAKIAQLVKYIDSKNKADCDVEMARWRSICGTSYRFIWNDKTKNKSSDSPFGFESLDPRETFVIYSTKNGHPPLMGVRVAYDSDRNKYYKIYTEDRYFEIKKREVINEVVNGYGAIPIIEYPNNARRISHVELIIDLQDALNKTQSDRLNGLEQHIQAFMKFINCDVNEDDLTRMRSLGAFVLKDVGGNKADVDLITSKLDQQETQTYKNDLYDSMQYILGIPSCEQNTGGDTGSAVFLRNGWQFAEQRACLRDIKFCACEREFLKIACDIMAIRRGIELDPNDIEVKVIRSKIDNMTVKANVLTLLLQAGIDFEIALKTVNMWSDPEDVYLSSKERLEFVHGKPQAENEMNEPQNQQKVSLIEQSAQSS